jgi:transposase
MGEVSTIGLDIAKSVFQVHGVDGAGAVVMRKRISRAKMLEFFADLPRCLVGMEACPSAHHWGRELQALGHTVRLMPPSYVKAYLKRSKNDANDAAAICEAVVRPSMRFVPIKTKEQQAGLMLHRTRQITALGLDHRSSAVAARKKHRIDCYDLPARQGAEKKRPSFQTRRAFVDRFGFRHRPAAQEPSRGIYPPGPLRPPMSFYAVLPCVVMQQFSNRSGNFKIYQYFQSLL